MADLGDLHAALAALEAPGKNAKVSFYYLVDSDLKMLSGAITVLDGRECVVQFQDLPADEALAQIAGLKFAKVTSLPTAVTTVAGESVPLPRVLTVLNPANRPAPAPAPAPEPPSQPSPAAAPVAATPLAATVEAKPHVFYSHLAMQKDATTLLEPFFGVGAEKKVEEIAKHTSPVHHGREFLDKCRQQAAMMVGAKKAEELFQPLFDKLS